MSKLEINEIGKQYGSFQALTGVSLVVEDGEFLTLLGPSGSGKTTLLKILAGFERPTSGRVLLGGRDITDVAPEQRNFGVVFQGYALFPHMSVFDNVAYPLRVRRLPKSVCEEKVGKMLDLVRLSEHARKRPAALSGGQQQRVALARALVFEPEILLLDEPMSALDKQLRYDLQEQLREVHRSLGTTFINVTHDQEEAMHMSNRIAVMNAGQIEQCAHPTELYNRPGTAFVAGFIGKTNPIPARLVPAAIGGASAFAEGIALFLRPEAATITPTLVAGADISLQCQVKSAAYSGDRSLYVLTAQDGSELMAYVPAKQEQIAAGETAYFSFDRKDLNILD